MSVLGREAPAVGEVTRPVAEGREFIALITALMATGALAIDVMLPAFPDMREEYGMAADSSQVGWVVTAFFLGVAVGPWLYGPASDRFGRRAPLFAGLLLYSVAGIGAALAPSFGWLIAARFVWGLGTAAPRSLSLAMIRDRYEGEAMARLMSMIMAVFLLVPIVAPSVGAGLNAIAPWRVVFWTPALIGVALLVWARRLPETLRPERRRPFTRASLVEALRAVVTNRQTVCFTLAITFLMGIMMGYLASSELILEDVYGYGDWFPLFFGSVAVVLAISSLNNARLVSRLGVTRLIRRMAAAGAVAVAALNVVAFASDGRPPFWLFCVSVGLVVPMAQGLVPNCNTAAMLPVPHVAGTAAAIIATVSTAGAALIGGLLSGAFDGTVRPYSAGAGLCFAVAGVLILVGSGGRTATPRPGSVPVG